MPEMHVAEEVMERYAMDRLSKAESGPVEEHLLVCQHCCQRVALLDEFVDSIRAAARTMPRAAAAGQNK